MKRELTEVYCGKAKGKTTLALGHSLRAAAEGKSVIIIQFLKGKERRSMDFLEELDHLDIKIFRFEKRDCCYDQLTEEEKAEERSNILNGLNFARKVVVTQECDLLVLDEILGLMEQGIVSTDVVGDILPAVGGDDAVFHREGGFGIQVLAGVDQARMFDQQVHR